MNFDVKNGKVSKCVGTDEIFTFPATVNIIGMQAVRDNLTVKKVIIPATVKIIRKSAFRGCLNLEEVVFEEDGVEHISDFVFFDCPKLKRVHLPASISELSACAFDSGTEISLASDRLYQIRDDSLMQADVLLSYHGKATHYTLPKAAKIVGQYAFANCNNLEEITIPPTVKTLERYCFFSCLNLKRLVFQGKVREIPEFACNSCAQLEEVVFPVNLAKIGEYAFADCKKLSITSLPPTIKTISEMAFFGYSGTPFFKDESSAWLKILSNDKLSIESWDANGEPHLKLNQHERIVQASKAYFDEFGLEIIKVEFDPWKTLYIEHCGYFQWKDERAILATSWEMACLPDWRPKNSVIGISAETARKIGKMQLKSALNENCVAVEIPDCSDTIMKKAMDGQSVRFPKLYSTSYKCIPMEKISCSDIVNGKLDLDFCNRFVYVELDGFNEYPKNGLIQYPIRLNLPVGTIATQDIADAYSDDGRHADFLKEFTSDYDDHNVYIYFTIEGQKFELIAGNEHISKMKIIDYKIENTGETYCIDVILRAEISQPRCY